MNSRIFVPLYSLTLLLSAALLFSVQPMFSKMILPLLGGTPQVWNTAMLFFQICLLGGYAYAHITSTYLHPRLQAGLHIALLLLFSLVLPFANPAQWSPPAHNDPTLWQLGLMATTVGGPFFILAASAPLIQRWFTFTQHKDAENPYFLYGASNLGSISALLAYPIIIEPLLNMSGQSISWAYGYYGLIALMVASALLVWKNFKPLTQTPSPHSKISWKQKGQWIFLAFIPSSLMLGVTTFITTDIAAVPLFWVLPLALYVGTFIIAFARKPVIDEQLATSIFTLLIIGLIVLRVSFNGLSLSPGGLIALHLVTFFFAALVCHTALVKAKPDASHLTSFYLYMSFGGALGGFFNAIIAPQFFIIPIEYSLVLILAVFVRTLHERPRITNATLSQLIMILKTKGLKILVSTPSLCVIFMLIGLLIYFGIPQKQLYYGAIGMIAASLFVMRGHRLLFTALVSIILCILPLGFNWGHGSFEKILHQDRSFFGVIKVIDTAENERILLHGTTNHGAQALDEKYRLKKLSYYSESSPISDVFALYDEKRGKQSIAVLGLGVGVTACYAKPQRHFDFFEIDPQIVSIAENKDYFTFLSDCGSPYDVILGDGRLKIAEKPDNTYDIVLADAFSSDNVPVHLLTEEAILIYMSKLKKDGTLIMNISNRYLDLEPVLAKTAEKLGLIFLAHTNNSGEIEGTDLKYYASHWAIFTNSKSVEKTLIAEGWEPGLLREGIEGWSDQYSNIFSVLGNTSGKKRIKDLKKFEGAP